jgi:hypothetical protein
MSVVMVRALLFICLFDNISTGVGANRCHQKNSSKRAMASTGADCRCSGATPAKVKLIKLRAMSTAAMNNPTNNWSPVPPVFMPVMTVPLPESRYGQGPPYICFLDYLHMSTVSGDESTINYYMRNQSEIYVSLELQHATSIQIRSKTSRLLRVRSMYSRSSCGQMDPQPRKSGPSILQRNP